MKRRISLIITVVLLMLSVSGCAAGQDDARTWFYEEDVISRMFVHPVSYDRMQPMSDGLSVLTPDLKFDDAKIGKAEYAGLFSEDDDTVLYAKNATKRLYPASMTKCMTALLVLENCSGFDELILVEEDAYADMTDDASLAFLSVGWSYSVTDLLYGLLLPSGNEAANVLAKRFGGTVSNFVRMMNERALQLGMVNTHFANPHGLHAANHYTTVYDLYLLMREVTKYDRFTEAAGTASAVIRSVRGTERQEKTVTTTNSYVRQFTLPPEGLTVRCGKTGYTVEAGRCLVLMSEDRAGKRYFGVVAKANGYDALYESMNALLSMAVEDL